jgi:hypothetical protein
MLVPKPLIIGVAAVLLSYGVVLLLIVPDAWNDYQDSFSTTFQNTTDETFCAKHPNCSPGGAVIKPHSAAHWDVNGSCFGDDGVPGTVYTDSGKLIYSRTVDCGDWANRTLFINKRGDDYIVADDFDAPDYEP